MKRRLVYHTVLYMELASKQNLAMWCSQLTLALLCVSMEVPKEVQDQNTKFTIYHAFLRKQIMTQTLFLCLKVVTLPSVYRTRVLGLCGNYDGRTNNEYTKPDGTVTRDLNVFGDSWRVTDRSAAAVRTTSLPKMVHLHKYDLCPKWHAIH